MGKKCCKLTPPCKGCPKLKKKKKKRMVAVDCEKGPIFYMLPALAAISGQRGSTAKSPACLAGVPA